MSTDPAREATEMDALARLRAAEQERDALREDAEHSLARERTAWDVHAEHAERMNALHLRDLARFEAAEAERDALQGQVDAWEEAYGVLAGRAGRAEATVARVEALIDPWKSNPLADTFGSFERRIRAALTGPVPAPEQTSEAP